MTRTLETRYSEFNSLFGIKKHELDSSQLQMFGAKFLSTFKLFMPTMDMNRGEDENSDYEEEIFIQQKEISIVSSSRRILNFQVSIDHKSMVQENREVTIELLGLDDHEFLGIRVTQFLKQKLEESGYFLFVNTRKWEMSVKDKTLYGPKKL